MKHTPGPWKAIGTEIATQKYQGDISFIIAHVNSKGISGAVHYSLPARANARLIALSPKMLNVLEAIVEQVYPCKLCEGTGKIEMEPGAFDACGNCGGYGFNPDGDIREAIIDARDVIAEAKGEANEH